MDDIRKQLKTARKLQNLSQKDLGGRLGFAQSYVSSIEAGKVEPLFKNVMEMARALDLELMLIPRKVVPAVRTLLSGKKQEPLWKIDDEDEEREDGNDS